MANVTELRVALTVEDFDRAVAFYRDALGLEQIADWSSETGKVVVLEAGRATLELFDSAQAESVDAIEAGRRVSGTVRFAVQVEDSVAVAERLVAAGAERVAEPVIAPWGDRNARVRAPDGMQLTLFSPGDLPGRFQLVAEQVHQQAVVEGAVGSALVLAHDPDGSEAHLGVTADGRLVGGRRVDRDPVVAALLEQEPGQQPDRLGPGAPALEAAAEVDVDPRLPVHRVVLLVVLDSPGDLPADLHHEKDR
jgi:catechol 2,3-dioxygenase-like lactoylglutathione lyase family enzyme